MKTTNFRNNQTYEFYYQFQEVLSEIQRLKEEANRYLSLLSQEEHGESDDLLSPSKKQSLTKEVESLQVCKYSFILRL